MDRRALNRNTLPFIDLHQERRIAQNRRVALNTKRLFGLALLVLVQVSGLLPLTLQALSFRPKMARAAQSLAEVDGRLQAETQKNAQLEPDLKRLERYQKSRDARRQINGIIRAIAQSKPRAIAIERLQIEVTDKQAHIQIQGIAQTQADLKECLVALSARPEFATLKLTETGEANIAGRRKIRFHADVAREIQ